MTRELCCAYLIHLFRGGPIPQKFGTMVFLLGGKGDLAYMGLTILILSEVGQNRQKGAKLSWKKVW